MTGTDFLNFSLAKNIVSSWGALSQTEWRSIPISKMQKHNIPSNPNRTYKDKGWVSWGDWLGTGTICSRKREFLPFQEARILARSLSKTLGITGKAKWASLSKKGLLPKTLPSSPPIAFKDKGWVSWGDWLGNWRGKNGRRFKINEDFFKTWSSSMAYVFGMWVADGCIYKAKGGLVFSISLEKTDEYLLQAILNEMGSDHKIYKNKNQRLITIGSNKICNDLIAIGGKTKKSLNVKFPYVPPMFIWDFIRGYFDGDGSCSVVHQKYLTANFVTGSKCLMDGLKQQMDLNNISYAYRVELERYYRISFGHKSFLKLGALMYSNSGIKMERKFKKWSEFYGKN